MTINMDHLTYELPVERKIIETPEAVSFSLKIPAALADKFKYKPGQFLTVCLKVNGQDIRRSYSLCTSPLVDKDFKITVKRVPGGLGSNFLIDQVHEGDMLRVTPPAGIFFKEPVGEARHFALFAAGSGITPIFSILKSVLQRPNNRVALLFANRFQEAVIYAEEIKDWENRYPDRLKIAHVFSQPKSDWSGFRGRCSPDTVREFLIDTHSTLKKEYYLCGPEGFMDSIQETLLTQSVKPENIHRESFLSPAELPKPEMEFPDDGVFIGDRAGAKGTPEQLEITLDGETFTLDYDPESNDSILETLINKGVNAPYSCMDGACMACMAKVTEGCVRQDDPGILADDNISSKECLTCQARPVGQLTKIDYDSI